MKGIISILTAGILLATGPARGAGLGVSPTNVNDQVGEGQAAFSNQVVVWNTNGTDAMTFTNTVSYTNCGVLTNWLIVAPASGVSSGENQAVWLRIDVTGVTPRTNAYEANVRVTAGPGTTNSPQDVRVTVLVQGIALGVAPTNLSKVVSAGQGNVYDAIFVANTGAAPRASMSYTVTTTNIGVTNAWLSVNPTTGNAQDNTNSVTVTYAPAGLTAGWYTGRVDVVALDVGTQSVAVVLQVNSRPGVAWNATDPGKVWTNEVTAGYSIGSTTLEVWNASGVPAAQMNYTVSVLDDPFGWVSVSNASGISTGDHQMVTVYYTTTQLVSGVYTARLSMSGVDAATGLPTTNGPLYMGLQLTVKGKQALKTDVTSLSQTLLENHTGTDSFLVFNDGRTPRGGMRFTVTPNVTWVTVIPTTGVVMDNFAVIQVQWDAGMLSPGTYSGNLTVTAADEQHPEIIADGSPLTIPLTLTVTPRTPLNLELPTVAGTMFIGQTVAATPGIWQSQPRLIFSYQWERASDKSGGGREVISGAVGANYVITTADRGKYLRVDVTATDPDPFAKSTTASSAWLNSAKVKALRADFNGDGITDLWFYNELLGEWHASFGANSPAEGVFPGRSGMIAVPGDFDGDGYEDLGVYDPAHGMWHILYLPRGDYVFGSLFGGTAEEAAATPVAADFDGDGATDVGLYYMGYWAVLYSSLGKVVVVSPFASIWGQPVTGDWDGNGTDEMGVYADGIWTLRMGDGSVVEQAFGGGGSGVLPAPADYDGDGATDLGVYDTVANQWRWRESRTGIEQIISFGTGGIVAIPGYYDHDSLNDWAQVHLSADNDFIVWEVKRTTETSFPYRGQSFQQSTDRWRVSW